MRFRILIASKGQRILQRASNRRTSQFLATTHYICATGLSAMEDQDVGTHEARELSDGTSYSIWMARINGFFLNEAYGSLFLNMISDVVVRCFYALILPLLGCGLALRCCRRGRKRKDEFSKRQLQQLNEVWEERGKALWLAEFAKLLEADHSCSAAEGDNSKSASGDGLEGGLAQTTEDGDVNITPEAISHKDGHVDQIQPLPTPEKRPIKPDVRKRLNGMVKHLKVDSEGRIVKHGGMEAATLTPEKPSLEPPPAKPSVEGKISTGQHGHVKYEHILDIPALAVLPSSATLESGDALKGLVKEKLGIKFIQDMCSSRILQASVKPTEENLRALRDLAIEGMKIDKEFTLQIDRFYMFYCKDNPEEPVLLSLMDVEVPTILQAEYTAGLLTIRGRSLEGAEIRVATMDEYLILHPEKQEQGGEIEEWRCTNLLLPAKLDKVHIFASKKVCIQKEYVTVRSEASPLVDNTLSTVLREWLPRAILFIFIFGHLLHFVTTILNFTLILQFPQLWLPNLLPTLVIYIIQVLPSSLEASIKSLVNQLKLLFASFKFTPLLEPTFIKQKNANFIEANSKSSCAKHSNTKFSDKSNEDSIKIQETGNQSPINLDWEWMCLTRRYSRKHDRWITEPMNSTNKQYNTLQPFEVIYRDTTHRDRFDSKTSSNFDKTSSNFDKISFGLSRAIVKIYSKGLQRILKKLVSTCHWHGFEDCVEIDAVYIFQVYLQGDLDKMIEFNNSVFNDASTMEETDLKTIQLHVFHLIRFIEREFEKSIVLHQQFISEGTISWELLWTLFQENEKAIYYCAMSNEELCGKVVSWQYTEVHDHWDDYGNGKKRPVFEIELEVWDYDCISYEPKIIKRKISEFFQERRISSLNVHPLKFQKDVAKTEAFFFNRGKMYHKLVLKTERCYMQYKGFMFWKFAEKRFINDEITHRESMDGRVMIDQGSYAKMKTKRRMGTAQPANGWLQGTLERDKDLPSENNLNLQFSPTIAYGFSFSLRKWGCFLIPQLQEITFNPTSFDTLVMKEEKTKELLLAMTKHYIKNPRLGPTTNEKVNTVDPLPNKGKGSIILLYGPPGTGKTLTVESLAEKMECPLWQLSVSTLNMKPKKLETSFMKKFEVAALWGAIMLLDEADVYLSSRKYSPFASNASQGNALTSVFLRILEYYKGILFLTTNEVSHFEPAIYSRISLFLKYEDFNSEQRRQLWSNFMKRVGIENITSMFWKEVLPVPLNGRVIRNIVSNAEIISGSQRKQLNENHILDAFRVMSHVATRNLLSIEEERDERDGQDFISIGGSISTISHQRSLPDIQSR